MSDSKVSRPPSLDALTGARFLAALTVVVFHFVMWWRQGLFTVTADGGFWWYAQTALYGLLDNGLAAVGFFFVLSGFVLSYSYLGDGDRVRGGVTSFYVARVARVYPIYLLGLLAAALPFWWAHGHPGRQYVATVGVTAATLLQAWFPNFVLLWNGPGWSLSVEAFFYATFPLFGVALSRLNRRQLLIAMGVLWIAGITAPTVALSLIYSGGIAPPAYGDAWLTVLLYNPLLRLPEFLMGVACGRLYLLAHKRDASAYPRTPSAAVLVPLGALALILVGRLPVSLGRTALLAPLWTVLIYALAPGRGAVAKILSMPPLVFLGEASYAIYILHEPAWFLMAHYFPPPSPSSPGPCLLYFAVYLTGVVVASASLRLAFEEPARYWIRQLFSRKAAATGIA